MQLLRACAVDLDPAVDDLDARRLRALGDERHLDLRRLRRVGVVLPVGGDLPRTTRNTIGGDSAAAFGGMLGPDDKITAVGTDIVTGDFAVARYTDNG